MHLADTQEKFEGKYEKFSKKLGEIGIKSFLVLSTLGGAILGYSMSDEADHLLEERNKELFIPIYNEAMEIMVRAGGTAVGAALGFIPAYFIYNDYTQNRNR